MAAKEVIVEITLLTGVRLMPAFALGTGGVIQQVFAFTDAQPGLDQLDRITAINGVSIKDEQALCTELQKGLRGQELKLTVARRPQAAPEANAATTKLEVAVDKTAADLGWGVCVSANRSGNALNVTGISEAAVRSTLQMGDFVVAVNGAAVTTLPMFRAAIAAAAGPQLKLTIDRRNQPKEQSVRTAVVAAGSGNAPREITVRLQYDEGEVIGMFLENLKVVRITPGSIAEDAFVVGDLVKQINNFKVSNDAEVYLKMSRAKGGVAVCVERTGPDPNAEKRNTPTTAGGPEGPPSASDDHVVMSIKLVMPPGQALGVTPNETSRVVKVQEKCIGEEHFKLGDVIKSVNGEPVGNDDMFSKMIEKHRPNLTIIIDRSKIREAEVELSQLPENIEKMIQRHAGHEYLIKDIKYDTNSNRPFGLALANCAHNRVIVTTAAPGSVAADSFRAYDRLLLINGTPVSDQTVAKEYICAAAGAFQVVIERPKTVATWGAVKTMYESWRRQQSAARAKEDELPADAMLIAAKLKEAIRAKTLTSAKCVLKKVKSNPSPADKKLTFGEKATVIEVVSDVAPGKKLRKC